MNLTWFARACAAAIVTCCAGAFALACSEADEGGGAEAVAQQQHAQAEPQQRPSEQEASSAEPQQQAAVPSGSSRPSSTSEDAAGSEPEAQAAEQQEDAAAADSESEAQSRDSSMSRQLEAQEQPASPYGDDYGQGEEAERPDDDPSDDIPPIRDWLAEGTQLTPSVPAAGDEYGWSAVVEGNVIAVGAPYHDAVAEDAGAVFVFERINGEWVETAYLLPEFGEYHGWFGRWIAIDQGRLVIGAPYESVPNMAGFEPIGTAGAVYVYEKVQGVWTRTATILSPQPVAGASFGWSVAIRGEWIAVSAWEDVVEGVSAGAVYVFTQVKGVWWPQARLEPNEPSYRLGFGRDIELDQNVLAVGAPGDDQVAEDAGAVYIYHFYNAAWNFAGKYIVPDGIKGDGLGYQIGLSVPWLAVGAPYQDEAGWETGAVYLWELSRDIWRSRGRLPVSDIQLGDWFGYAPAVQGDTIVVGSPHRAHPETRVFRAGASYVYVREGSEWRELGVIGPVDAVASGERAEFGWVTDVDGSTVVVGAWTANTEEGENAGRAAVFEIAELAADSDSE